MLVWNLILSKPWINFISTKMCSLSNTYFDLHVWSCTTRNKYLTVLSHWNLNPLWPRWHHAIHTALEISTNLEYVCDILISRMTFGENFITYDKCVYAITGVWIDTDWIVQTYSKNEMWYCFLYDIVQNCLGCKIT